MVQFCTLFLSDININKQKLDDWNSRLALSDSVAHVGIEIHKSCKCANAVDARIRKGRSSLFSLLTIRDSVNDVDPLTLADLVQKISIPSRGG